MDGASYLPVRCRTMVHDDIPWILSLAHERYGEFDPGGALTFLLQALRSPITLMLRTESAFLIANHVAPPWWPKRRECHVMFLCAGEGAHWQAVGLLRESVAWARLQGCVRWRFHSETGFAVDALCRRVGAHEDSPRYAIDLEGSSHG